MKKKYIIEGLDCANCGAKIEDAISKMDGVNSASVSFLTEKVKLDLADDIDLVAFLKEANEIADKIEPGSVIKEK